MLLNTNCFMVKKSEKKFSYSMLGNLFFYTFTIDL